MNNVKKVVLYILPLFIIVPIFVIQMSNPLRQSDEVIRKDMLDLTPIGTSKYAVIEVVNEIGGNIIMSSTGINATIGRYRNIMGTNRFVAVSWEFDENEKLIEITVWRSYHAIPLGW